MPHAIARERRPERHAEPGAVRYRRHDRNIADAGSLHVGGGQHGQHSRLTPRLRCIDPPDRREGMGRAYEHAMGRARHSLVIEELAGANQQLVILDTRLERQAHRCAPL